MRCTVCGSPRIFHYDAPNDKAYCKSHRLDIIAYMERLAQGEEDITFQKMRNFPQRLRDG